MKIDVLDRGYVRLVEAWGHGDVGIGYDTDHPYDYECGIIEAARQSTQGSFRGWEKDQRLLKYLFTHKPQHATPFEFAGMILEVEAPTCVVWEWVRHRTHTLEDGEFPGDTAFNVMSSRYGEIPYNDLLPTVGRITKVPDGNKQAGTAAGSPQITEQSAGQWVNSLAELYDHAQRVYKDGLDRGVPKEVARLALTFGRYWRFRVSAYLRNWVGFLLLRNHPDAQEEIREYAKAVDRIVAATFPRTRALLSEVGG